MKVIWRFVFSIACCVLVSFGSGLSSDAPLSPSSRVKGSFPAGVEELLLHTVLLWQWKTLFPWGGPTAPLTVLSVGDLSGDGHEDIVVSNYQAIYLFTAKPDETIHTHLVGFYEVTWHNGKSFTVTGFVLPKAGALLDLDADGDQDLVVATGGDQPSLYLFSNAGGGGLDKIASIPIPKQPQALWAQDFTGDGIADLLWWTSDPDNQGKLYLHEGQGQFLFGKATPVLKAQGQPFALADINYDRALDLALYTSERVLLFFGDHKGFPQSSEWVSEYGEIRTAVVQQNAQDRMRILLATAKGLVSIAFLAGKFMVDAFVPLGPLSWVFSLDLTEDGVEDALVRTRTGWTVVPRNKEGRFLLPTSEFEFLGALTFSPGQTLWPMKVGGKPTFVLGTKPFPTLWRIGGEPKGETFLPFNGTYLLAVGDLSGDGAPELVVEGSVGIDVLWNDGRGGFVRQPFLTEPIDNVIFAVVEGGRLYFLRFAEKARGWLATELWIVSAAGQVLERDVLEKFGPHQTNEIQPALCVRDFDQDGKLDVLVLKNDAIFVKWAAEEWSIYPWTEGKLGLAVCGQFSRTDLPEIALISDAGVFYVAFPERSLEAKKVLPQLEQFPLALAAGDIDRDGLDNLVMLTLEVQVGVEGMELKVTLLEPRGWIVQPEGQLVELKLPELGEGDVPWPLRGLALGEFTGDEQMDLVFTTTHGAGVFILPGGEGGFAPALRISRAIGPIFAADLDRSGQADLVSSSLGINPYLWILWNGGGQ